MFESTRSTRRKKIAAIVAITNTVMVAVPVSRRVAQEIRFISWRTCLTNCAGDVFAMVDQCRYKFQKSLTTPRPDTKSGTSRGSFPTMCRFRFSSDLFRYRGGYLAKRTHHGNRILTAGRRNITVLFAWQLRAYCAPSVSRHYTPLQYHKTASQTNCGHHPANAYATLEIRITTNPNH